MLENVKNNLFYSIDNNNIQENFSDDLEFLSIDKKWVDSQNWPVNLSNYGVYNFKLAENIEFDSNDKYFTFNRGKSKDTNFNGNGFKIIIKNVDKYQGLFRVGLENYFFNLDIVNLGLISEKSLLTTSRGWIIGYPPKASLKIKIISCYSVGEVPEFGGGIVGGGAGIGSLLMIENCYNKCHRINRFGGGIIGAGTGNGKYEGRDQEAIISNCYSNSKIIGDKAGGIIGYNSNGVTTKVKNCYSTGKVEKNGDLITTSAENKNKYKPIKIINCGGSNDGIWDVEMAKKYLENYFISSSKNFVPSEESKWIYVDFRKGFLTRHEFESISKKDIIKRVKDREVIEVDLKFQNQMLNSQAEEEVVIEEEDEIIVEEEQNDFSLVIIIILIITIIIGSVVAFTFFIPSEE